MLNDIKILIDEELQEYSYNSINGEIVCNLDLNDSYDTINILYDENIYSIKYNGKHTNESVDKILIEDNNLSSLTFNVELNYKYFIKSIYKYLNKFIDKNGLLDELDLFINSKVGKKYNKELSILKESIEEKSIDDLLLSDIDEQSRVENILLNNELYIDLATQMTDLDLVLLITSYLSLNVVPKIDQEKFDELVIAAKNYDHALENIWRLAMSYDDRGYNYDLVDKFFVDSRNAWYLSEYISSINQVNQEKVVDLIVASKDQEFIEKLLADNFIQCHLEEKYQEILKCTLNNM